MIQKMSSVVAKWMEQEGAISGEEKDLFSYAVYCLLFGMLPVFIVAVLGLVLGMLREGFVMIAPFMMIRKFSGGYHLRSPKLCVIFSTILLASSMGFIKIIVYKGDLSFLTVVVTLSIICLCTFSPVDNNSRKLTKNEQRQFHKVACVFAMLSLVGYLIMCKAISIQYAAAFGVGILLAAMLQLFGVVARTIGTTV